MLSRKALTFLRQQRFYSITKTLRNILKDKILLNRDHAISNAKTMVMFSINFCLIKAERTTAYLSFNLQKPDFYHIEYYCELICMREKINCQNLSSGTALNEYFHLFISAKFLLRLTR